MRKIYILNLHQGKVGRTGGPGPVGEKGEEGIQGVAGVTGPRGVQGFASEKGRSGVDVCCTWKWSEFSCIGWALYKSRCFLFRVYLEMMDYTVMMVERVKLGKSGLEDME